MEDGGQDGCDWEPKSRTGRFAKRLNLRPVRRHKSLPALVHCRFVRPNGELGGVVSFHENYILEHYNPTPPLPYQKD